jgi:hypothetical protein
LTWCPPSACTEEAQNAALEVEGTFVLELTPCQTVSLDSEADLNLDALYIEELDIVRVGEEEGFLHPTIERSWCAKRLRAGRIFDRGVKGPV